MRTNLLKRLMAIGLTCGSIMTLSPIAANAEWKEENGNKYYLHVNGEKAIGWLRDNDNGKWYYMDESGVMEKNTTIIEKDESGKEHKYVLGADGALIDNDNKYNNNYRISYPTEDPDLVIDWVRKNKKWYASRNGEKLTGLQKDSRGGLFYMDKDGAMQINTVVNIDGAIYNISNSGMCTRIN